MKDEELQNFSRIKDTAMKSIQLIIYSIVLMTLCSCAMFYDKQSASSPGVQSPKPLVLPVGKNWQVIEEAPKLRDERERLPFQTEQSVQPEGTKTVSPADTRKIEMPR
jgi:hypothetical protein